MANRNLISLQEYVISVNCAFFKSKMYVVILAIVIPF